MSLARACVTRAASKNPALLLLLCLPIATDVRTRVPFGPQRSPSLTTPTPTGRGVITHPRKPILHRIHPPNPAINPTQKTPILFISLQILFILFKTPPLPLCLHCHWCPHQCPVRPSTPPPSLTTLAPTSRGGITHPTNPSSTAFTHQTPPSTQHKKLPSCSSLRKSCSSCLKLRLFLRASTATGVRTSVPLHLLPTLPQAY
jgi:hypothetical protein